MFPNTLTITETLVDDQANPSSVSPTTLLPPFVSYVQIGNSVAITFTPLASTPGGTYPVSFTTSDTVAT